MIQNGLVRNLWEELHMANKKLDEGRVPWTKLVQRHGFPDIKSMLKAWYIDRDESASIIALRLDISISSVQKKLSEFGLRKGRKKQQRMLF